MVRISLFCCLFIFSIQGFAQRQDSLFVAQDDQRWIINHSIKSNETVFSIARKYHVPPAMLADENEITFQTSLKPNTTIKIPVGAYNLVKAKPQQQNDYRPIYTIVGDDESLYRIARLTNVPQKNIQQWNGLYDNDISQGQRLLVGWILYDNTPMPSLQKTTNKTLSQPPTTSTPKVEAKPQQTTTTTKRPENPTWTQTWDTFRVAKPTDTSKGLLADTSVSPAKALYLSQTFNEESVTDEKGPAAFFNSNSDFKSQFLFAFHNTAGKGKIIRVKNLNNGRVVYVKVLGAIPQTGLYHNAIIGLSSRAKQALGATGDRVWCELKYAP